MKFNKKYIKCSLMFQNQLSGYLLRKFKNSNGWQKLWVVFTNFCLFFFKTYQVLSFFMIPCIYLWTKNYRKQSFDIYIVYTQCKTSEIFREFEIELFQIYCGHSIVTASNSWIRSWWSLYYFFPITGWFPFSQSAIARLRRKHARGRRWHQQRSCL